MKIVCIKVGKKYSSDYVNRLESMVKRHLKIPYEFVCITDDPKGVRGKTIEAVPYLTGWWQKIALFAPKPYGIDEKFLFLDLDVVILDDITEMVEMEDDFVIIQDWLWPMYNSSVFLLEPGARKEVYDKFIENPDAAIERSPGGDQDWITQNAEAKIWPLDWCRSYRVHCRNAPSGKIVVFHGSPNPHEVKGGWVKEFWK